MYTSRVVAGLNQIQFEDVLESAFRERGGTSQGKGNYQRKLLVFLMKQKGRVCHFEDIAEKVFSQHFTENTRRLIHAQVKRVNDKLDHYFATQKSTPFRLQVQTIRGAGLRLATVSRLAESVLIYELRRLEMTYLNSKGDYKQTTHIKVANRGETSVAELNPEYIGFYTRQHPLSLVVAHAQSGRFSMTPSGEETRTLRFQSTTKTVYVTAYKIAVDPPVSAGEVVELKYHFETRGTEIDAFTSVSGTYAGTYIGEVTKLLQLECFAPRSYKFQPVHQRYVGLVYAPDGEFDESLTNEFPRPSLGTARLTWHLSRPLQSFRHWLWFRVVPQ